MARKTSQRRVQPPISPKPGMSLNPNKLSSKSRIAEAIHDLVDSQSRDGDAAFAQTSTATSPLSDGSWYNSSCPASSRARAYYTYDPAGRISSINHWRDTWNTSSSSWDASDYLLGNA